MALPLSEAFTARAIGASWNNYKNNLGLPPYLGRSFFGTQKRQGLTLEWIKGSHGLPVALKGANFDGQAPLRDGITFQTLAQNMPFFRESYMVSEKEEQDYMTFASSANADMANQVLAEIMKKPLDLIQGADVVPERMIWSLLAAADGVPKITITVDGGSTYNIDYTGDNGVAYKSTNYQAISTPADQWNAASTATPIQDLVDFQDNYEATYGAKLGTFIMNQRTWKLLVNAEDTKKQVLGNVAYTAGIMIKDAEVKDFLLSNYGITVLVYNKMYSDNGVTRTFIPDGVVSAIVEGVATLGNVWYGTTPEERSGSLATGSLSLVNTGVSVYTYATNHPINTHCVVSEIVLPSYEGMDNVAIMKVTA